MNKDLISLGISYKYYQTGKVHNISYLLEDNLNVFRKGLRKYLVSKFNNRIKFINKGSIYNVEFYLDDTLINIDILNNIVISIKDINKNYLIKELVSVFNNIFMDNMFLSYVYTSYKEYPKVEELRYEWSFYKENRLIDIVNHNNVSNTYRLVNFKDYFNINKVYSISKLDRDSYNYYILPTIDNYKYTMYKVNLLIKYSKFSKIDIYNWLSNNKTYIKKLSI